MPRSKDSQIDFASFIVTLTCVLAPLWSSAAPENAQATRQTCFTEANVNQVLKYNWATFSKYGFFERPGLELLELYLSHACANVKRPVSNYLPSSDRPNDVWQYSVELNNYITNRFRKAGLQAYARSVAHIHRHEIHARLAAKVGRLQVDPNDHGTPGFRPPVQRPPLYNEEHPLVDCREWRDDQFVLVNPISIRCPVEGCVETLEFRNDHRAHYTPTNRHRGLDIDYGNNGDEVKAYSPFPGCVAAVYKEKESGTNGLGNHVLITARVSANYIEALNFSGNRVVLDGDIYVTVLLAHLRDDSITARIGEFITDTRNKPIGLMGDSGTANGEHVHIEMQVGRINTLEEWHRTRGETIDPAALIP